MFNEQGPYVQFKLDTLKRATPAQSAIVFGDVYMVDGGYSRKCLDYGCKEVLLIDSLKTLQCGRRAALRTGPFRANPARGGAP
jgi:hypothetical protein